VAINKRVALAAIIAVSVSACGSLPTIGQRANTVPAAEAERQEAEKEVKSQKLYFKLIREMQDKGKHRAAIAFVDEYEQAYPSNPISQLLRGRSMVALKEHEQAEAILLPLTSTPAAPEAYNELGKMWAAKGDWTRAASNFEMAREKAPTHVNFINNLGYAEIKTGRYAEAEKVLMQGLELDETNMSVRHNLILAKFMQGKKGEVRKIIGTLDEQERQFVIALLKQWNDTVLVGSEK